MYVLIVVFYTYLSKKNYGYSTVENLGAIPHVNCLKRQHYYDNMPITEFAEI